MDYLGNNLCHPCRQRNLDYSHSISVRGNSSTPLPREQTMVTIPLPVPVGGRTEITLPSWQLMLGLAVLIPGLVIGAGLTLGIIYIIISRIVARTTSSADYQKKAAALEKRQTDVIADMRQTRPTSAAPETTWRRWSVITTTMAIIMFLAFLTLLLTGMIFPTGQIVRNGSIVNITFALVMIVSLIALTIMAIWLRSERIAALNNTESLAIPWDFIAIVMTGLLVVGLGIGVIAILNMPQ